MPGLWETMKNKYPRPKTIAVDVDGTLIIEGELNRSLVDWCRAKQAEGYTLILWSMQGQEHAQEVVEEYWQLEGLFDYVISKPGTIVDDDGWQWTRYTEVITGE